MEEKHKDAIRKTFSSLVEQTDLELMVATLFEKGVFSEPMIEPYKDQSRDQRTRKRQLYRDITRRGPLAFDLLVEALMENGYWGLVRDLDPESGLHPINPRRPRPGPSQPGQGSSSFLSIFDKKRHNTGKEQDDPNNPRAGGAGQTPNPKPGSREDPNGNVEPPAASEGGGAGDAPGAGDATTIPKFNVIKSTKFFEDDDGSDIKLYRTRGRNRGVLLLFSYEKFKYDIETFREGAHADRVNLKYLFTEIGFKVLTYTGLTLEETKQALSELKHGLCGERPETVWVVFSSHGYARAGTGDTDIRCADGHLISYYEVIDYFNNERFPTLHGIPKVFIFQTCRGSNKVGPNSPLRPPSPRRPRPRARPPAHRRPRAPAGVARDGTVYGDSDSDSGDSDSERDEEAQKRNYSDILIAHSTVPRYASNRDLKEGSWYIQSLCDVFAARAHDCHAADLFTLVDAELGRRFGTQTSSVDRWGFNRHLYLHPGLYEDAPPPAPTPAPAAP